MDHNPFEAKRALRRSVRRSIRNLSPELREKADAAIAARLVALREWREATSVLLYNALPDEVSTEPVLMSALETGKRLYLPRVARGKITFHRIADADTLGSLAVRVLGIREPAPDAPRWPPDSDAAEDAPTPTLIVCPGRAFDGSGNRLGRGGGYYDGFLGALAAADGDETERANARRYVVGVCYEVQLVGSLPVTAHDVPVDMLVTEEKTLRFKDGNSASRSTDSH